MKKAITILMLIAAFLIGGATVEAKTTKKKSKAKTSSTIGYFNYNGMKCTMLSNGRIQCSSRGSSGKYQKRDGGKYYWVELSNDSGAHYLLLTGSNAYFIDAGSAGMISDFSYDPSTKKVKITEVDGDRIYSLEDLQQYFTYNSLYQPLSNFQYIGKVTWTR